MKYVFFGVFALFSLSSHAHTITYDNGDVYTVKDNEYVFVATQQELWRKQSLNNGRTIQYKKVTPVEKVDYVPVDDGTTDDMTVGSHEWCKAYIPWSEGFTFNMQAWMRYCDTDNNNSYGCGDKTCDSSDDASVCPAG